MAKIVRYGWKKVCQSMDLASRFRLIKSETYKQVHSWPIHSNLQSGNMHNWLEFYFQVRCDKFQSTFQRCHPAFSYTKTVFASHLAFSDLVSLQGLGTLQSLSQPLTPLYTKVFWVKYAICLTDKAWPKLGHKTGQWSQVQMQIYNPHG